VPPPCGSQVPRGFCRFPSHAKQPIGAPAHDAQSPTHARVVRHRSVAPLHARQSLALVHWPLQRTPGHPASAGGGWGVETEPSDPSGPDAASGGEPASAAPPASAAAPGPCGPPCAVAGGALTSKPASSPPTMASPTLSSPHPSPDATAQTTAATPIPAPRFRILAARLCTLAGR
jgi:hypothetical protein